VNSFLIIIFFAIVFFSYKKPLFGIIALLLLNCTFTIPTDFMSISLPGVGILLLSDIIVIVLFIKSIRTIYKEWNIIPELKLFVALVGCFIFSGFVLLLLGSISANEAFRLIAREGMIWLIPANILALSNKDKGILIKALILISLFVCIVQFYFLLNPNVSLIAQAYYQFRSQDDPEIAAQFVFDNQTPRLYPAGTLLVQMVLGFVLTILFLKVIDIKNIYIKLLLLLTLISATVFTYTLGGRSNLLAMVVTMIMVLVYKNKKQPAKISFSIAAAILLIAGTIVLDNALKLNVFASIVEKTETQFAAQGTEYLFYDRRSDNEDAINVLLNSPIWGIGKSNTGIESELGSGQDVHGVLSLGLQAGFVGLFIFIIISYKVYKRIKTIKQRQPTKERWALPAIFALTPAMILLLLNTTPSIIGLRNLLPVGIFIGFILSEFRKIPKTKTVSNV
jgi:hypothetical protein